MGTARPAATIDDYPCRVSRDRRLSGKSTDATSSRSNPRVVTPPDAPSDAWDIVPWLLCALALAFLTGLRGWLDVLDGGGVRITPRTHLDAAGLLRASNQALRAQPHYAVPMTPDLKLHPGGERMMESG